MTSENSMVTPKSFTAVTICGMAQQLEKQCQNQEHKNGVENELVAKDGESLLCKTEHWINDCGLNPVHSKRIERT